MAITVHESHTGSGLLVAEQAVTGDAVARALKAYEPSLRLVPQVDKAGGGLRWCVFQWQGPDRDAHFVCAWADEQGNALPLSMQLLEKVRMLDPSTRGSASDPNRLNEEHVERSRRDSLADKEAIAEDFVPYLDRKRVSVSFTESERHHLRPSKPRGREG